MPQGLLDGPSGVAQAYTPTWRERVAGLLQDGFERMGWSRYGARKVGESIAGGPGSNLPMGLGLLDATPVGLAFAREENPEHGPSVPSAAAGPLAKLARIKASPATEQAMKAVGYESGWFRGGPKPIDNRMTGPWYTRNADEAADYARRFGKNADVREYAVPSSPMLKMDRVYTPRLAQDVAAKAEEGFGEQGAKLAALIRSSYKDGEQASGMELWRGTSKTLGDDAAARIFAELGFRSVLGINSPFYLRMLPGATVRDAARAKFDPQKIGLDNIMAGVGGLELLGAATRSQDGE